MVPLGMLCVTTRPAADRSRRRVTTNGPLLARCVVAHGIPSVDLPSCGASHEISRPEARAQGWNEEPPLLGSEQRVRGPMLRIAKVPVVVIS
jgi:hypothetical protein